MKQYAVAVKQLIKLERSDEAIISIMKAIKLKKDATQAYIILGSAFKNLEFKNQI